MNTTLIPDIIVPLNDEIPDIIVPLNDEIHQLAKQFAKEQTTPEKREQVLLNTYSVYAVHTYLNWVEINSQLDLSYSWHPFHQKISNVADLMLPGLGKIECLHIKPEQSNIKEIKVSSDALSNRFGYVIVQFTETINQVKLLGFVLPKYVDIKAQKLNLDDVKPLDDLLLHIFHLEESIKILEKELEGKEDNKNFDIVKETILDKQLPQIITEFYDFYDDGNYKTDDDYIEKAANIFLPQKEVELLKGDEDEVLEMIGEIQDFAEELLEKFAEIWQEN